MVELAWNWMNFAIGQDGRIVWIGRVLRRFEVRKTELKVCGGQMWWIRCNFDQVGIIKYHLAI
jgi:hypothetical protein